MNRDELLTLKKSIQSAYDADIAAIEHLLKKFPAPENKTLPLNGDGFITDKKIFGLVEAFLQNRTEPFSLNDVVEFIDVSTGQNPNRQTVSTAIFRLKEENKIVVKQKGQGRRPAVYEKAL